MSIALGRLIGTLQDTRLSIYGVDPWCAMCVHETDLVRLLRGQPDASAQTCWSAVVLWQMSRRPMTSVEGAVMDFASAPGRWLEMSARHDVHVELGKDVGDERSEETRTGHGGCRVFFTNKIP